MTTLGGVVFGLLLARFACTRSKSVPSIKISTGTLMIAEAAGCAPVGPLH